MLIIGMVLLGAMMLAGYVIGFARVLRWVIGIPVLLAVGWYLMIVAQEPAEHARMCATGLYHNSKDPCDEDRKVVLPPPPTVCNGHKPSAAETLFGCG
jgi:hypothetical protein